MKKTGLTRRIDELGRIVIPKEIRKNLKIRDCDELEISVKADNIILNKYVSINKDQIVDIILNGINKKTNKNILFTSKDQVISYVMENKEELSCLELSNSVIKLVENRQAVGSNITKFCLFNDIINISYHINPIVINGDLVGSLILYSENDNITENDRLIIDFSSLFLEKYLE